MEKECNCTEECATGYNPNCKCEADECNCTDECECNDCCCDDNHNC